MRRCVSWVLVAAALTGCGSNRERPRYPSDATVYQCEGGKQLVVQYLDRGKSAMVFYPDREFRLDQVSAASGARYSNGRTTLSTKGRDAVLEENGQALFSGCSAAG